MMRSTLVLLALLSTIGCGGGGGGGARSTTAAAVTSAAPVATGSATSAPVGTATGGTGGTGGTPGEHVRTSGGRRYVVVAPQVTRARPLPVVVLFHGSGDDALNFASVARAAGWHAAAGQEELLLVVPDTKSPYGSFPVWSGNPNNDLAAMRAELDDVLGLVRREVMTRWDVDPRSVHALGFSDGGLLLAAVGLGHPELATTTILGYGWGPFYPQPPATRRPAHLACGTADRFFAGAEQAQAFLRAQGHEVLWEPVAGAGHSFSQLSRAASPAASLRWMVQRPLAGTATTPAPTTTPASPAPPAPRGLVTRQVTTQAQPGLPSITVGVDVYVPASYDPAVASPLVVAANMGLGPWRALADQEGLIVIDLRDADRNGGFDFGHDVLLLDAALRDVEATWRVDAKRRYYHGFSAGAHWGYAVVLANANAFAGLGISAGSLQVAIQQGVFPGGVQRRLPVAIRHGAQDAVVPVAAARLDRDRLTQAGHAVTLEEFQGGHTIAEADARAVWAALRAHRAP